MEYLDINWLAITQSLINVNQVVSSSFFFFFSFLFSHWFIRLNLLQTVVIKAGTRDFHLHLSSQLSCGPPRLFHYLHLTLYCSSPFILGLPVFLLPSGVRWRLSLLLNIFLLFIQQGYTMWHTLHKWASLGYLSHWVALGTYIVYFLI